MAEGFAARYPGRCAAGDAIEPGDTVRFVPSAEDEGDVLIHEHCLPEHVTEVDGKRHKFQGTSLEEMGY